MSFAIFTQCFITVDLCVVCLHFNQCLLLFICMFDLGIKTTKETWRLTGKSQRNFEVFDLDSRSDIWLSFLIWSWAWQSCAPPLLQTIIHELLVTLFSQNLARHLLLMWKLTHWADLYVSAQLAMDYL